MSWPAGDIVFPGLEPDYEFVRTIGRGASGWVALVRHVPLRRLEAVKTIRAGSRQLPAVRRLEREARVLGRLSHPGIVTVYRLLTSPTSVAMIMEYVPGGDLQQAIDKEWLSGSERIAVLSQVADALTVAAAAGVVHRDVKPSNVLLGAGGRAVLADFGLARLPAEQTAFRTMSGAVTGTPLFMAPEQIEDPDNESPSVDAYAFGVLAYKLMVGRWPYPATNVADVIAAHRTLSPTPPWEYSGQLPRRAGAALLAALAKHPDDRMGPDVLMRRLRQTSDASWDALVGIPSQHHQGMDGQPQVPDDDLTRPLAGDAGIDGGGLATGANGGLATGANGGLATGANGGLATGANGGLATGADGGLATGADGGGQSMGSDPSSPTDGPNSAADPLVVDVWVQPPIYVVPRRRRSTVVLGVVGLLVVGLLGLVIYIVVVTL